MGIFDFLRRGKRPSIIGFGERIGYGEKESIHEKVARSLLRSPILVVNAKKIREMLSGGKITAIMLKEEEVGRLGEKLLSMKHTGLIERELGLRFATEKLPGRFLIFVDKKPEELENIIKKLELSGIEEPMKKLLRTALRRNVVTKELGEKILNELKPKRRIGARVVEKMLPKRTSPKLPWARSVRSPKPK